MKPPFRRYAIDLVAVPEDFRLALHDSGNRTGSLEFSVWLYDNDGNLLNGTGKAIDLNLTPERYKQFLTGVNGHFEISVPKAAVSFSGSEYATSHQIASAQLRFRFLPSGNYPH